MTLTSTVGPGGVPRRGLRPASGLPPPASCLPRPASAPTGSSSAAPHPQPFALDVHLRPVAVEGDDDALRRPSPRTRARLADLDGSRDRASSASRASPSDRLGLGGERPPLRPARAADAWASARGLRARAVELLLDAPRELAARPLESREPLGEHPRALLRELAAARSRGARSPRCAPLALAAELGLGARAGARSPSSASVSARSRRCQASPRISSARVEHRLGRCRARARPRARGCGRRAPGAGGSSGGPSSRRTPSPRRAASARDAAKLLTAERCVVTSARPPRSTIRLEKRDARALPSSGSVAPPISSISASVSGPGLVEDAGQASPSTTRTSSGPRGSPARRRSRCGSRGRPAGGFPTPRGSGCPHCASIEKSPAVFRTTVLPPGVGARDDEQPPVGRQLEIERHRVAARRATRRARAGAASRSGRRAADAARRRASSCRRRRSPEGGPRPSRRRRPWPRGRRAPRARPTASSSRPPRASTARAELAEQPLDLAPLLARRAGRGRCWPR